MDGRILRRLAPAFLSHPSPRRQNVGVYIYAHFSTRARNETPAEDVGVRNLATRRCVIGPEVVVVIVSFPLCGSSFARIISGEARAVRESRLRCCSLRMACAARRQLQCARTTALCG